jgi:hypothetical protein
MDLASSPHDQSYRALLDRPNAAGALLRERLPKELADQIIGDSTLVEGSFIDEGMRRSQCDRLYRVHLRSGGEAFVYFLIEHKSAPDGRVALQSKALAQVLDRRFGVLPARDRRRIAGAGRGELETWLNRAVDASTLDAVFSPSAKH